MLRGGGVVEFFGFADEAFDEGEAVVRGIESFSGFV